jgi:acyl-CoA thioester hydrolase
MVEFSKLISIRWSDIDADFHLRHSAYYDLSTQIRMQVLQEYGITMALMKEKSFGPVILREECQFKREIKQEDNIILSVAMSKSTKNTSRFTIVHEFINDSNKLCAIVTIDGAWINVNLRRFTTLPQDIISILLNDLPKTKDFTITN